MRRTVSRWPVETLSSDRADEAFGVGVCPRRTDWRFDHDDPFAAEDLVEGGGELAVSVVDRKPHPFEEAGEAEVARLLADPGAAGVGGAAREMDAAAFELDEEEDVEAAQRDRLDGEEIASEHARGLLAQELLTARPRAPRRRPRVRVKQDASDRARRHTQIELQQLASDPRVAPTRVLACEAQNELSHPAIDGRAACGPPRLRPLATDEFPMPAQCRSSTTSWCRNTGNSTSLANSLLRRRRAAAAQPRRRDPPKRHFETPQGATARARVPSALLFLAGDRGLQVGRAAVSLTPEGMGG